MSTQWLRLPIIIIHVTYGKRGSADVGYFGEVWESLQYLPTYKSARWQCTFERGGGNCRPPSRVDDAKYLQLSLRGENSKHLSPNVGPPVTYEHASFPPQIALAQDMPCRKILLIGLGPTAWFSFSYYHLMRKVE